MAGTALGGQSPSSPDDPLLELTFDRTTVPDLRNEVRRCADRCGLTDDLALAKYVTAVNEIVTNAVRHGGGRGVLRMWLDGRALHCLVVDHGPGVPVRWLDTAARSDSGALPRRGLWLARQICNSIDVETSRSGTRVLLRYVLPARPRRI